MENEEVYIIIKFVKKNIYIIFDYYIYILIKFFIFSLNIGNILIIINYIKF